MDDRTTRRDAALALLALGAAGWSGPLQAQIKSGDDPDGNPVWKKVRASLFQSRPISQAAAGIVELDMPLRAEDAAVVPVAIRLQAPQTPTRYVQALYLVIDNNPSPISAVFRFTPQSGRADIETRVRVDEYTHVRAIAEMNDGRLVMATRWVKASGGCSAPPTKDAAAALATLGRMKLRVDGAVEPGRPALAQLMISHPNHSGLAMDQATRQYTPARFVRQVDVSYQGRPVMSAEVDFSISENPNFRFWFVPEGVGNGVLKASVVDSEDKRFEEMVTLAP